MGAPSDGALTAHDDGRTHRAQGTAPQDPVAPPAARRAGPHRPRVRSGRVVLLADLAVVVPAVVASGHWAAVVGAVTGVLLLARAGSYRERLTLSALDDLPALVGATLGGAGAALAGAAVAGGRPVPSLAAALTVVALAAARLLAYAWLRHSRRGGRGRRALVVGCGDLGGRLVSALRDHPECGLEPVGFVDEDPLLPPALRPVPILGRLRDLPTLLQAGAADVVVVAFGAANESATVDVLRACDRLPVEVLVVPRFYELHSRTGDDEHVRGLPLVRLRRPAFRAPGWRLKRVLDVLAAAVGLLLAAPVLAACAVAVRLEGGPGVLFRQERVGLDGRPFTLLKFRSIQPASDAESGTRWSVAGSDRIGPVGRFLRCSSLDELPQLWNVLRGDMSLVGPRPERPHFVDRFSLEHEEYVWRHRVPVGVTGWAQVNGLRGDTPIAERARYDNDYIENWSLWWDLKILVRTLSALRSGS